MIQPLFNWRTGLAIIAIAIVSGTIFYSQFLANKIAREERGKVAERVEAQKIIAPGHHRHQRPAHHHDIDGKQNYSYHRH